MRMEASCFAEGAMWALKTLAKALVAAEERTSGSTKINAQHLSDCMAPPMTLIAGEIKNEAEARFPDIVHEPKRMWVLAPQMKDE